jgi:exoribonuclease R
MNRNWIAGTLELTSKVRYGMTSRGVPIFRFIPYDRTLGPFAVGCSSRELFYNVHAIVEPGEKKENEYKTLPRATLVQNLGRPTPASEEKVLLAAYAHDNQKSLTHRAPFVFLPKCEEERVKLSGHTFHIDPPGCKDVDDTFTFSWDSAKCVWHCSINIADVSAYVEEGSPLDREAAVRATTFYTPQGAAAEPMLPRELSEKHASLLPDENPKKTLSLCFDYAKKELMNISWKLTETQTNTSYTYDEADDIVDYSLDMTILQEIAVVLGGSAESSHDWVATLMIFYNKQAGELLAKHGTGILRHHKGPGQSNGEGEGEGIEGIEGIPKFLAYESAEYCQPSQGNTHFGLGINNYAYASSPIRRYADLVNQRAIKKILKGEKPADIPLVLIQELNRREKQAKAFSRDLFFMTCLSVSSQDNQVIGVVMSSEQRETYLKTTIWVPEWRRKIKSKGLRQQQSLTPGSKVSIRWYDQPTQPRWKERIVFNISSTTLTKTAEH